MPLNPQLQALLDANPTVDAAKQLQAKMPEVSQHFEKQLQERLAEIQVELQQVQAEMAQQQEQQRPKPSLANRAKDLLEEAKEACEWMRAMATLKKLQTAPTIQNFNQVRGMFKGCEQFLQRNPRAVSAVGMAQQQMPGSTILGNPLQQQVQAQRNPLSPSAQLQTLLSQQMRSPGLSALRPQPKGQKDEDQLGKAIDKALELTSSPTAAAGAVHAVIGIVAGALAKLASALDAPPLTKSPFAIPELKPKGSEAAGG